MFVTQNMLSGGQIFQTNSKIHKYNTHHRNNLHSPCQKNTRKFECKPSIVGGRFAPPTWVYTRNWVFIWVYTEVGSANLPPTIEGLHSFFWVFTPNLHPILGVHSSWGCESTPNYWGFTLILLSVYSELFECYFGCKLKLGVPVYPQLLSVCPQ